MIMFIVGILCVGAMLMVGFILFSWTVAYPLSMLAAVLFFPAVWWLATIWQNHDDRKRQVAMGNHPTHLPIAEPCGTALDDPLDGLR